MSATVLDPEVLEAATSPDDGDNLDHAICECSPHDSLCGLHFPEWDLIEFEPDDPDACIVCASVAVCPRCGDVFDSSEVSSR